MIYFCALRTENKKIVLVEVFNLAGKMLIQKEVNESEKDLSLELDNFNSGIYLISTLLEDGTKSSSKVFLEK